MQDMGNGSEQWPFISKMRMRTVMPPHSIIMNAKWDPRYKLLSTFSVNVIYYWYLYATSLFLWAEHYFFFSCPSSHLCKIFKKESQNSLGEYFSSQMVWVGCYRQACVFFFFSAIVSTFLSCVACHIDSRPSKHIDLNVTPRLTQESWRKWDKLPGASPAKKYSFYEIMLTP